MTYCVGILVQDGLVMLADTRTNAGLDNISTFRKLQIIEVPGERVIAVASAGNLAASQAVMQLVTEGFGEEEEETRTLQTVGSMFEAAQLIGKAVQRVYAADGPAMEAQKTRFDVMMLVGGQVNGGRLRLFQVYSAGNFIKASPDTPYLQIGEHKYGKPILDRAISHDTELLDALKLGLISMDSTMRSNLGVGMPIDLMVYRRDALKTDLVRRVDETDAYFAGLRSSWSDALSQAHKAIPRPPYSGEIGAGADD